MIGIDAEQPLTERGTVAMLRRSHAKASLRRQTTQPQFTHTSAPDARQTPKAISGNSAENVSPSENSEPALQSSLPEQLKVLLAGALNGTAESPAAAVVVDKAVALDNNDHPKRRFADVVAVRMLIRNWVTVSLRDYETRARISGNQKHSEAASDALYQFNTSLIFEPLPVTIHRAASLFGLNDTSEPRRLGSPVISSARSAAANLFKHPAPQADNNNYNNNSNNNSDAIATKPTSDPATSQLEATRTSGEERCKPVQVSETVVSEHSGNTTTATGKPQDREAAKPRRHVQLQLDADQLPQAEEPLSVLSDRPAHVASSSLAKALRLLPRAARFLASAMTNCAQKARKARDFAIALPLQTIDPSKAFFYYWTMIVYVAFLYNSIFCVIFVFGDTADNGAFMRLWLFFNFVFDAVNLLDIFICSKLTLMEDGMLIRSWRQLAKRYCKSRYFALDLLSILPIDALIVLWRNASLLRVNRLLKCHRVLDFVERTNMRTNYPNGFRIFHIVIICVILFHWNAALYFKISLLNGLSSMNVLAWEFNYVKNMDLVLPECDMPNDKTEQQPGRLYAYDERCGFNENGRDVDTRNTYMDELSAFWRGRIQHILFSNFSKQYSLSIYWSSLTLTTSGQQPYPTEELHNLLEIFDTIVGVLVFAVIVGSVGNVVTTMNRGRAERQQLMDGIKFYMNYRNVSAEIQRRVMDCVNYVQHNEMIQNEEAIMESIPPRLQGELAVNLHMETLQRVELLSDCEPNLLYELVLRLQMHVFAPNDFLCRCGDVAKEMYIVKSGLLESLSASGEHLETFRDGSTFGELSIMRMVGAERSNRRYRSLRSIGYSEVYVLKQEDVLYVLRDYPEARSNLLSKARELMRRNAASADNQQRSALDEEGLESQQIVGTQNVDETLQMLTATMRRIDEELREMFAQFQKRSSGMKKRMTRLEEVYRLNRTAMKEQFFHRHPP